MIPQRHAIKPYSQNNPFSLGRAPTLGNLPQEDALLQPAADINHELKAMAAPLAVPVRCWIGAVGEPQQEPRGGCRHVQTF